MTNSRKTILSICSLLGLIVLSHGPASAIGSASTKFQVVVPPSDRTERHTALVVTAIAASGTTIDVIDDDADGDDDDSQLGLHLERGQSVVLYMRDGLVNDDFGGTADGDYFIVDADRPVFVQMATSSNWQHDFAPSTNGTSIGHNFFIWASPSSGAENDINVFAYEDGTDVTVTKISPSPLDASGTTAIDLASEQLVLAIEMDEGEDLFTVHGLGNDSLEQGHTYWIKSTKPITVQYGHLHGSTRAGGGFVPSRNGSSTGDLMYFAIPYDAGSPSQKELRLVSYDDDADVTLSGYDTGLQDYVTVDTQTLDAYETADYVGSTNSIFADYDLYRLEVTPGKRVTAFEANWLETGSPGTSDFSSALSSSNGLGAGTDFVAYMGPPGNANHANLPGVTPGLYSHLFVSAFYDQTNVTVVDLETGGSLFHATAQLSADDYHDFFLDVATWDSMSATGRPYLLVTSDRPVSVTNTNFNDNWMNFFTSGLFPDPRVQLISSQPDVTCGQSATITVTASNLEADALSNVVLDATIPSGLIWEPATLSSSGSVSFASATVSANPDGSNNVHFVGAGNLTQGSEFTVSFDVTLDCSQISSCFAGGLADITAEVLGDASGQLYGGVDAIVLPLAADDLNQLTQASAAFDQDSGGVLVSWTIEDEDGRADYEVFRSTDPNEVGDSIAVVTGSRGTSSISDYSIVDTDLSVETFYYRVTSQADSCSESLGPFEVAVDDAQWCVPVEIPWLEFRSDVRLNWPRTRLACALEYVVYRGDISILAAGDSGSCVADGLWRSRWDDREVPPSGVAWMYLVGARTAAGTGTVGTASSGAARPTPAPCD